MGGCGLFGQTDVALPLQPIGPSPSFIPLNSLIVLHNFSVLGFSFVVIRTLKTTAGKSSTSRADCRRSASGITKPFNYSSQLDCWPAFHSAVFLRNKVVLVLETNVAVPCSRSGSERIKPFFYASLLMEICYLSSRLQHIGQ